VNGRAFVAIASILLVFSLRSARAEVLEADDLSTPRRAMATFVDAANHDDWPRAIAVLGVSRSASAERKAQAVELAQELDYVLSRSLSFELDSISDDPQGKLDDGVDIEKVAGLHAKGRVIPIVLSHVNGPPARWLISTGTLANVPELYRERGPSPLERYLPASLLRETLGMARWQWLGLPLAMALAVLFASAIVHVSSRFGGHLAAKTRAVWDDELVVALRAPGRLFVGVVTFVALVHLMSLPGTPKLVCVRIASTLGIIALVWMLIRVVQVATDLVERRAIHATAGQKDAALRVGGVRTRVRVLRRIVSVVLSFCAGAVILLQFEVVRSIGVSLLASAGVAGIVLGLAAQRTLGSLFAGIQLSITQPIRIGDEVRIENETGTIEEITLTYVVVRVWDERRLIVPMTRFLEQPFQNFTKVSAELHGTVLLNADATLPVDAVRRELDRLLETNARWDRRSKAVHVTDVKGRTLELRVLVSAASSGELFDLRAELRERLAAWLATFEGGKYLSK